jgi:hypothetical protein
MGTIVGPDLAYMHMPKTGGTWIAQVLSRYGFGELRSEWHDHGVDIDTEDRLVLGSIRDPWAWYLSLVRYGRRGRAPWLDPYIEAVGTYDEPRIIRAMLHPHQIQSDSPHFTWLPGEPDLSAYRRAAMHAYWPDRFILPRREDCLADVLVSTETAGHGLLQALSAWPVPSAMVQECLRAHQTRSSTALHEVYDQSLIEAVAEREAWALDMFGFECGRPSPTIWLTGHGVV